MKRTPIISVFTASLMFLMVFLASCSKKTGAKNEDLEEEAAVTVNVQKTKLSSLSDYIEFSGDVKAKNSVDIFSTVSGKITRIYVKNGDKVSANQIIAEVDSSRPGAVYAASPVRSSIAGTIVNLPASLGAQVSTSSVLATVGQVENLEISLEVPERFSSLVKVNQNAQISFAALPGKNFYGQVEEVSPVIDSATRSCHLILKIDSKSTEIKPGMSARVHLITETLENIIVIPSNALVSWNDENYVFLAEEKDGQTRAVKYPVETGLKVDGLVQIKEGLEEDRMILVKGQKLIGDGQLINAIEINDQKL